MESKNATMQKPKVSNETIAPARLASPAEETRQPEIVERAPLAMQDEGRMPAEAQIRALAHELYRARCDMGHEGDELSDWVAAERKLNPLGESAERRLNPHDEDAARSLRAPARTEPIQAPRLRGDGEVPPA